MTIREVAESLERFERELAAGRRRAAYEAALTAWRACRAPELAALVDRAAIVFAPNTPLAENKQAAFVEAWLARARNREPYERRWLLDQLERLALAHKSSLVASCLDELVVTQDDPSIALPACTMAGMPGGTVNFGSWGKVLTRLFKLIVNAGDPRAIAPLDKLAKATMQPGSPRTPSTDQDLARRIPKVVTALRKCTVVPLDAELTTLVTRSLALLDKPLSPANTEAAAATRDDALLAAVLADLDDDAARAVWADALQQAGDPRGELIALQLAGTANAKAAKAADKLITKHWRTWLGPIAPAVVRDSLEFDRGLLVACTTDVRRKGVSDAVFSHPNWGTVRRIAFRAYGHLTPAMSRLEEARGVPEDGLEALATTTFAHLRVLEIRGDPGFHDRTGGGPRSKSMKALATTKGLPSLRSLGFDGSYFLRGTPEHCRWIFETPFAGQLETFAIKVDWPEWESDVVSSWLAVMRPAAALRRIEFRASAVLVIDPKASIATLEHDLRVSVGDPRSWVETPITVARALADTAGLVMGPAVISTAPRKRQPS